MLDQNRKTSTCFAGTLQRHHTPKVNWGKGRKSTAGGRRKTGERRDCQRISGKRRRKFMAVSGTGDRRDCQRISGKKRRKFMAVSSVPYYFRKTNHSLAAKFRRAHSAMEMPPAT